MCHEEATRQQQEQKERSRPRHDRLLVVCCRSICSHDSCLFLALLIPNRNFVRDIRSPLRRSLDSSSKLPPSWRRSSRGTCVLDENAWLFSSWVKQRVASCPRDEQASSLAGAERQPARRYGPMAPFRYRGARLAVLAPVHISKARSLHCLSCPCAARSYDSSASNKKAIGVGRRGSTDRPVVVRRFIP
jgi:hypothetical protein